MRVWPRRAALLDRRPRSQHATAAMDELGIGAVDGAGRGRTVASGAAKSRPWMVVARLATRPAGPAAARSGRAATVRALDGGVRPAPRQGPVAAASRAVAEGRHD